MGRLVKCYGQDCIKDNIKHDKDKMFKLGSHNYCKTCYDKEIIEREGRQKVYDYVANVYNLTMPTPLMMKHIKEMKEDYKWSYKRIGLLIKYVIEIKNKKLDPKYGLKYYANYYTEMLEYYANKNKRVQKNKGKMHKIINKTIKGRFDSENYYRKSKLIDPGEID